MTIKIFSRDPISRDELHRIRLIMDEAECPNEALRNTFSRYVSTDGRGIHFDSDREASNAYEIDMREPRPE